MFQKLTSAFNERTSSIFFRKYRRRRGPDETSMINRNLLASVLLIITVYNIPPSSFSRMDYPQYYAIFLLNDSKALMDDRLRITVCIVQIRNFIVDKFFFPPPIDRSIQNRNNLINAWAIARNDSLSLRFAPGVTLCRLSPSPSLRSPLPFSFFLFFPPKR